MLKVMAGIGAIGIYVPRARLPLSRIAEAWGRPPQRGQIAVAHWDEDALTMAVEAVQRCLAAAAAASLPPVDALYFASTSAPYAEKQVASFVATACDLPRTVATADFRGSTRCGLAALLAAVRAVRCGDVRHAVVVAADARVARPGSDLEGQLGDGAAAVSVVAQDPVAEVFAAGAVSEQVTDFWRLDGCAWVERADARFGDRENYVPDMQEAVRRTLAGAGLELEQVALLALSGPGPRAVAALARRLGVAPGRLVPGCAESFGQTGSAEPFLLLARALARIPPGETLLVGAYGEGGEALLLRAMPALERRRPESIEPWIEDGVEMGNYLRFLRYRRLIEIDEPEETVSPALERHEVEQNIRLHGSRCERCGTTQYPPAEVCIGCREHGVLRRVPLTRRGRVFTYTIDQLIPTFEPPLVMAVVDLDGGGRLYVQVTETGRVEIGDRVVLAFRRLHRGGGNVNYYWKARPPRAAEGRE